VDGAGSGNQPFLDPPPPCNGRTDVRLYGAAGDGVQVDSFAIQRAIDTCAQSKGTVLVPAGTYLIGPLFLRTNTTLELADGALLQASSDMDDFTAAAAQNGGIVPSIINGTNVNTIKLTGTGIIDGAGAPWWALQSMAEDTNAPDPFRPHLIYFKHVANVTVENVTLRNSPKFHVLLESSTSALFSNVTITAPRNSPNTDGIDPKSSTHVHITGCNISSGDDNVAVTSAGIPVPTAHDILVENCTFGAGHGVSIGSYASGGVGSMTVQHCTFSGTQNGIRIKSARDRGGNVSGLVYDDLQMTGVGNAIYFTEYYPSIPMPGTDTAPATISFTTPHYHDITISNVTATGGRNAGVLIGVPESLIENIQLENVNITATNGLTLRNTRNVAFTGSSITVTSGTPLVMQENAAADGL
jgi:polygalacturonase